LESVSMWSDQLTRITRLKNIWENESTTAEVEAWKMALAAGNQDVADDYQQRLEMKQRLVGSSNAASLLRSHKIDALHSKSEPSTDPNTHSPAAKWTTAAKSFSEQRAIEWNEDQVRVSSGEGGASIAYRSPILGDFEFGCQLELSEDADVALTFGGLYVEINLSYGYYSAHTPDFEYYESGRFPGSNLDSARLRLSRVGQQLHIQIGNATLPIFQLQDNASPWLELGVPYAGQVTFSAMELACETAAQPNVTLLESGIDGWAMPHNRFDAEQLTQLMDDSAFAMLGALQRTRDSTNERAELWTLDSGVLTIADPRWGPQITSNSTRPEPALHRQPFRDPILLTQSHRFFPRAIDVGETILWQAAWQPVADSSPSVPNASPADRGRKLGATERVVCLLGDLIVSRTPQPEDGQGGWHLARLLPPGQVVELSRRELDALVIDSPTPSADQTFPATEGDWREFQLKVESGSVRLRMDGGNEIRLRRKSNGLPLLGFGITPDAKMQVRQLILEGVW
ncbi:MAG: hypothetical protein AAGG44_09265, partial [Planctomycetota bacterium]